MSPNALAFPSLSVSRCPLVSLLSSGGEMEEGMSGVAIFFTVLFCMLGFFMLVVVGLVVYSHWNENRRKRFYWDEGQTTGASTERRVRRQALLLRGGSTWRQALLLATVHPSDNLDIANLMTLRRFFFAPFEIFEYVCYPKETLWLTDEMKRLQHNVQ